MIYRGRVFRRLKTHEKVLDGAFALVFLVIALIMAFAGVTAIHAVVIAGAVLLRRWSPALALGTAWLAAAVEMALFAQPGVENIGILMVLYATAAYGNRVVMGFGLGSAAVGAGVAALYLAIAPNGFVGATGLEYLATGDGIRGLVLIGGALLLLLGAAWLLGLLHRTVARARASADARELAEREIVVEQERNRIARDMHDVVAHSLAVVIAQADGARYLTSAERPEVGHALETIAGTARGALGEVRGLLAQLRHRQEAGPQPDLSRLPALLAELRSAGLDIRADGIDDVGDVSEGTSIAAYRILQESLTNALRHAPGETVTLLFEHDAAAGRLVFTVRNRHVDTGGPLRLGHGLAGMSERAALVGGELEAGVQSGEFVVQGRLPRGPVVAEASA